MCNQRILETEYKLLVCIVSFASFKADTLLHDRYDCQISASAFTLCSKEEKVLFSQC